MSRYEQFSLLSSYVYTFTTIVLLIVALLQFRHLRRDSSVRATLLLLEQEANDPNVKKARYDFHRVIRHMPSMDELLTAEECEHEREILRSVLNRYEYIAIGISEKALDFRIFKRLWRSSTIHDWRRLEGFIHAARTRHDSPALWIEFENLKRRID